MCYTWEHSNHELKSLWNFGPFSWHPTVFMPVPRGVEWDTCCPTPKVRWPVLQKTGSPGQKHPGSGTKVNSAPSWLCSGEPDKGAAIQDVQMSGHTIRESLARGYGDRQGTVETTCLNVHKARDGCIKPEMEKDIPVFLCGTLFHSLKVKSLSELVLLLLFILNICKLMHMSREKDQNLKTQIFKF